MTGTGALPDPRDPRDWPIDVLVGAGGGMLLSSVRHDHACGAALDQGATNACTGFAAAKQALAWARIRGLPVAELSPRGAYWLARWVGRIAGEPTGDIGAYPRRLSRALARYGYLPEISVPWGESLVNEELSWTRDAGAGH